MPQFLDFVVRKFPKLAIYQRLAKLRELMLYLNLQGSVSAAFPQHINRFLFSSGGRLCSVVNSRTAEWMNEMKR